MNGKRSCHARRPPGDRSAASRRRRAASPATRSGCWSAIAAATSTRGSATSPTSCRRGRCSSSTRSATLPASLPAIGPLRGRSPSTSSTRYGDRPVAGGAALERRAAGAARRSMPASASRPPACRRGFVAPIPGLPRLWFVALDGNVERAMALEGEPIRYGYVAGALSAALRLPDHLRRGAGKRRDAVGRPPLHRSGWSTSFAGAERIARRSSSTPACRASRPTAGSERPLYPEPFIVPARTAAAVNAARSEGRAGHRRRHHRRPGAGNGLRRDAASGRPRASPGCSSIPGAACRPSTA